VPPGPRAKWALLRNHQPSAAVARREAGLAVIRDVPVASGRKRRARRYVILSASCCKCPRCRACSSTHAMKDDDYRPETAGSLRHQHNF